MLSDKIGITYPLTALADSYFKSNSDNARIHFLILPFSIGIDNMCLTTSTLETTVHSADNK